MTRTSRLVMVGVVFAIAGPLIAGCGDDTVGDGGPSTSLEPSLSTNPPAPPSTTPPPGPTASGPDLSIISTLGPLASCGDAVFHFATPEGELLLRVEIPGVLAMVEDSGGPADLSFDLADRAGAATATIEAGTGLAGTACNDVADADYEITDSWTAERGTVRLRIGALPEGPLDACQSEVDVTAEIDGIVFIDGADRWTIPPLTLDGTIGGCPR